MERRDFINNLAISTLPIVFLPTHIFSTSKKSADKGVEKVLNYIKKTWKKTFFIDKPDEGFKGVSLPYPYSSPCVKGEGHFTFFFYWDTYFTNLGLISHEHQNQVKNNIKNILWFINEQGYMPNHTAAYNRSQPPYLQLMVSNYFQNVLEEDPKFYQKCAEGIKKEYQFWMTARNTPLGLNQYGHHDTEQGCVDFYNSFLVRRLNFNPNISDEEKATIGGHHWGEAESGWDFSQRYYGKSLNYANTDLNALLYGYEMYLYEASIKLDWYHKDFYKNKAEKRKELINKFLWNDELGWFFDYDFKNKKQSEIYALAAMQFLFMGIASNEQAEKMVKNLPLLEKKYGIAVANKTPDSNNYQWAYPAVWPPMVYITVMGLDRYNYIKDAKRIAQKYIDVTVALFEKNGRLWEKTNAETGELHNVEYDSAPLMDWSAGVFVALTNYLNLTNN